MDRLSILKKDDRKYFNVSYMDWDHFKHVILHGAAQDISAILRYDCVLGGVDYTTDFR